MYCNNNPVMYSDGSGNFPFLALTAIIGAVIGGVAIGVTSYQNGARGWEVAGWTVLGATGGGLIGAGLGAFVAGAMAGSFAASCGAVKAGALAVYNMAIVAGLTGAWYMMFDNLSNSFYYTTHVFWSGGDVARNKAEVFAMDIGGKTLEMTKLGQYLEKYFSGPNYNQIVWEIASMNFANQVKFNDFVYAFLYYPEMRENGIWMKEMLELLKKAVEIIKGGR
jgi:hypothetical protein